MKNDGSYRRLVKDQLLHKLRDKQLLLRGNKDTHPFKSSRALGLAVLVRGTGKEDAGWSSVPSSTAIHHVRGPLFFWGTLGNFVDQNVVLSMEYFVIYYTLSSFPHPDTHTIYEDNCKARRAPAETSLMDRKEEMGEKCKKWKERSTQGGAGMRRS